MLIHERLILSLRSRRLSNIFISWDLHFVQMVNHVIRQAVSYLDLIDAHVILDAEALERIVSLHLMHDEHFAIDYDDFILDVYDVLVVVIHPLKRCLLHFFLTA